jgi:hypothetical protein
MLITSFIYINHANYMAWPLQIRIGEEPEKKIGEEPEKKKKRSGGS